MTATDKKNSYDCLWQPLRINGMLLKNRIVMAPMCSLTTLSSSRESEFGFSHYEERARGGVGLIQLGAQHVDRKAAGSSVSMIMSDPHSIPTATALIERCHRWGAKVAVQISSGAGRYGGPVNGEPPYSASATPCFANKKLLTRPMTTDEIHGLVKSFGQAAANAKKMGFDAINIHAHTGYLLDQFMTPLWNQREDEYGGPLENRARLVCEIIAAVRKAVGPHFPIIIRFSPEHKFPGGRTLEESIPFIRLFEQAGVDALDLDIGSYEALDHIFPTAYMPDGALAYACARIREITSLPIINTGAHTPETAEALLESGNADLVAFGRQLLADPELPNKLRDDRREDIRPCLMCNEECVGRFTVRQTQISCAVNPSCGMEQWMRVTPLPDARRVVIIGAGPGGLEAACTAARRGCRVTVFEQADHIGGTLGDIATADFKRRIRALIAWYGRQLEQLGVELRLNCVINADAPELAEADAIFVAAGSRPVIPQLEGIDNALVTDVVSAHRHGVSAERVAVCGGGLSGCDCALELAQQGKQVCVIEQGKRWAADALGVNRISLRRELADNKVELLTETTVVGFTDAGVRIRTADGSEGLIPAEAMILAFGQRPENETSEEILRRFPRKTTLIGDCRQIGKAGNAIRDGFYAALSLQ